MAMVWAEGRDDVFRSIETGRMSPAHVVEFMRTSSAPALKSEIDEEHRLHRVRGVMEELDALVGLRKVKKTIEEIYAFAEVQRMRREHQLQSEPQVLHMVFRGNPLCVSVEAEGRRDAPL
jgi:stage V sporulation protein K